jgi:DNA-binding NtrC family response regulator
MIVFVDDSEDLCELVLQLLELELGVAGLALASMAAVVSRAEDVLRSRAIILDINLGHNHPDGLDILVWLQKNSYKGRVSFLTGHGRHHPRVVEAIKTGVMVMEKPISPEEFLNFVRTALDPDAREKLDEKTR